MNDMRDDTKLTLEHAVAEATEMGMMIRFPRPNELFVDLDEEGAWENFLTQLKLLQHHMPLSYSSTSSKSGLPHRHVVVTLEREVSNETERVLLQLLLGSDQRREMRSYLSILTGRNARPTLFFEQPKGEKPVYIDRNDGGY